MKKLFCGDCLEVMDHLPDASVDAVVCDPPYGSTRCKWDVVIPFAPLWRAYSRVCKPGAPIILTATQPFTSLLVLSNLKGFRYDLVWEKSTASGHLNAKKCPMRAHESVLIFCAGKMRYFPQKTTGHIRKTAKKVDRAKKLSDCYGGQKGVTSYDSTERFPRSVFKTTTDKQRSKLHPTQKPVALMEWLLQHYTLPGWTILDNAMGSGTTGATCASLGRDFIGIEKDKDIFEKAENRLR